MANKMWGGRFGQKPDPLMEEINTSIDFDRHLYRQDIAASKAHAAMLAKTGIITTQDAKQIAHGLDTILSEIEAGKFKFKRALEDIHMNVEGRLGGLIGRPAATIRSRPTSGCSFAMRLTASMPRSPPIRRHSPRRPSNTPRP